MQHYIYKQLSYHLQKRASALCYHLIIFSKIWLLVFCYTLRVGFFSKPTWQQMRVCKNSTHSSLTCSF